MTRLTGIALTLILIALAAPVGAQTPPAKPEAAAPVDAPIVAEEQQDSRQTRDELRTILERYPPEVGRVLKLDPTLLRNDLWMTAYPALATFIAGHPQVTHSPAFYLEGISGSEPVPQTSSARVWSSMFEAIQIVLTVALVFGAAGWMLRTLIEHKRWSRLSRVQAEVHTKLMDRLTSNEELLAYIQTPAGKRFLESAPIQLDSAPRSVSAPVGRILWSVQVGVVLAAAGIGMQVISAGVEKDVASPLFALGILAISVGAGFILSAFVSLVLSRRFGLLEPAPGSATE